MYLFNEKLSRKLFLFSILLLIQFYSKIIAQDMIFELPIVGDTIDYAEKVKFILFDKIPNNDYYFSIISERNSDTLITHYKKSDTVEVKANFQYITSIINNISKLNTYYNSINNEQDYIPKDYSKISNPNPNQKTNYPEDDSRLDSLLATKPMNNKIIKRKNIKKYFTQSEGGPPIEKLTEIEKRQRNDGFIYTTPAFAPPTRVIPNH